MKYVVIFQLVYQLLAGLLRDAGLPESILRLSDLINAVLLVGLVVSPEKKRLKPAKNILLALGLWLGYMIVSALFKAPDPRQILSSVHIWGRGFVLLCAAFVFLDRKDMDWILQMMNFALVFHFLLICVEFFVFDKKRDTLGGIFGSKMGCNAPNTVYMTFMLAWTLCRVFEEDRVKPIAVFTPFATMIAAGMMELKIFFYFYPVVIGLVMLMYAVRGKAKRKTVVPMVLCAVAALGIGLYIMYLLYPTHFLLLIGKRSLADYEEKCRVPYAISRTHFVSEINDWTFHGSLPLNLTGYGFGNCIDGSVFAAQNQDWCYQLFSNQLLFLEGGFIGLMLFAAIPMVSCVEHGLALLRKKDTLPHVLGCVFALMMTVIIFYNNSYHTETAYLIWFAITISYFLTFDDKSEASERGKVCAIPH